MADTTPQEDEREFTGRILRGDGGAFSALLERYQPRVFRLVHGILGDWHRSEDVCQEIFTTVFRKLPDFRHQSRLSTWIYRISVNAALKARRRYGKFGAETAEGLRDLVSPGDPRPERVEGNEVFRKLLAPLPEKLRVAVVLREQMGLNYQEMAGVLGCSRGAVEQRLHRAMVALREIWNGVDKTDWLEL